MSNRAALSELWDTAKWLVRTFFNIFGEPQEMAACGAFDRKNYTWLIAWLRAVEAFVRRLLLIEAKALGAPASCRQSASAGRTPAVRARQIFTLNPDDWRVSFRWLPGASKIGARGLRPRISAIGDAEQAPPEAARSNVHPSMPLAFRAEALYRVCKNPLPYVRRLARRIARAPTLIARILVPPHERKRKSGDPPNPIAIIGPTTWARTCALTADTS